VARNSRSYVSGVDQVNSEFPVETIIAGLVDRSEEHRQRENSIILHIAKQLREPRHIDEIVTIALDNHQDVFRHSMQVKQAVWSVVSEGKLTFMKDMTFGVTEFLPDANGWYRPEVAPPKSGLYQVILRMKGGGLWWNEGQVCFVKDQHAKWTIGDSEELLAWREIPELHEPEWIK